LAVSLMLIDEVSRVEECPLIGRKFLEEDRQAQQGD
jgi:hypothetical protein